MGAVCYSLKLLISEVSVLTYKLVGFRCVEFVATEFLWGLICKFG
ncbi:MAG: hypothetical protein ACKERG_00850 [Candidatus Hodgkinia cicadicola]